MGLGNTFNRLKTAWQQANERAERDRLEKKIKSEQANQEMYERVLAKRELDSKSRRRSDRGWYESVEGLLHKSQDRQTELERQLRALDGFPPPVHQDRATAASLAVALTDWQGQLLARLQQLDPMQFEYLAAKLLQSAGLTEVRVLGGSGDQGIDGVGQHRILRKSFPVYFQCKRYQRSVGPSEVRDFRGVLDGRTGQGLLITTGTFTAAAREEADRRGGAKPIELVDGEELVDLLRDYGLGLVIDDDLGRVLQLDNSFFDRLGRRRNT